MFVRTLKLFCITFIFCQNALADSELEKNVANIVQTMIQQSEWPPIPSPNADFTATDEKVDAGLEQIMDRLNAAIFLGRPGFKIRFTDYGNIVCDSERKYILVNPEILEFILSHKNSRSLAAAALLAHEMAHYLEVIATSRDLLQLKIFKYRIPEENITHAYVEVIAAEILRRAGYSKLEIALGFSYVHRPMASLMATLSPHSTDLKTRRAVLAEWFGSRK